MKTILYATDYSKNSAAALKYAHSLSTQLGMRLVITHVFDYPTVLGLEGLDEPFPRTEQNAIKKHRAKLEEFCEEHLGSKWNSTSIQIEPVENESVLHGIISKADDWHAAMIITGMKGESNLRELLMGSTTKKLIEKAPCPILAIPYDMRHTAIKTIVYATDFEDEDIHAIQKLVEIAKPLEAEIKVVHISTKKEYKGDLQMEWFREMLRTKVEYSKIECKLLFSEKIFESLRRYLGDVNADLMVMLEREKQGILNKLFQQDLVKKMESYGKVPLLSFNEHNHHTLLF
ncbi:MAG: universal stress protein [Flavobacteriaceae bacterium]